jgi:hypothetical protein
VGPAVPDIPSLQAAVARRDTRTIIAATSLVVGPLLMTIGDLLHPEERMSHREQIAILVDHSSSWYLAHLLLLVGFLLFVPGLLALSALAGARRPAAGYAARIFIMVGTGAFVAVFVFEMLVGRFVSGGADPASAVTLLEHFFSVPIFAALGPAMLAFFIGAAIFAVPLIRAGGTLRWAAALILTGVLLILAEILSAEVLLSRIGNLLAFCGSATVAWLLLRGRTVGAPGYLDI